MTLDKKYFIYLRLSELHKLKNISLQPVIFGSGICKNIDKGSRQRDL